LLCRCKRDTVLTPEQERKTKLEETPLPDISLECTVSC
jgi:hypothetical protein